MEIITSKYQVFCDTFNTSAEAKMHEANGKRKLHFTITDDKGKHEISLWEEDVLLLTDFLEGISQHLDSRL